MRFVVAAAAIALIACGRTPSPELSLRGSPDPTAVEVSGLPSRDIDALTSLSRERWSDVLRVEVNGAAGQAIAGDYSVRDGRITFTPMYGFDKGRTFLATFDASRIPGASGEPWRQPPLRRTFALSADAPRPATVVRQVFPSGDALPENMLRFYLEFSAPMGRGSAIEHVHLLDESGKEVVDPFLPVEAELWNAERTRFTLFFDPGRVKRGIKPNRDMGRALIAGTRYTLLVDAEWRDGNGQPLKQEHRHTFTAVPAIERGLDTAAWTLSIPRARTREPLTVTFPWPLDIGLLQRALGVQSGSTPVSGDVAIDGNETRWTFTPRDAWLEGNYRLVALTLLEDPAGNRIGRAFEVTRAVDERERVEIGVTVK